MSVITTQFLRKPLYVDAVRITRENFDEVATWCQGEIKQDEVPGKGTSVKYIKVRVHNPKNPRQTKAMIGDWILYTDRGYKIYTNKAFHTSFDEVIQLEQEAEPGEKLSEIQDDPNIVIIGPECFAQKDGSVLSWKGVNYIPQEEPGSNGSLSEMVEATREAEALEEQRNEGLVGGEEEIELVPATPENIAQAVKDTEEARAKEETA